jgi:hypothetical protein
MKQTLEQIQKIVDDIPFLEYEGLKYKWIPKQSLQNLPNFSKLSLMMPVLNVTDPLVLNTVSSKKCAVNVGDLFAFYRDYEHVSPYYYYRILVAS